MPIPRKSDLRCPVCLCEYSFIAMANSGIKQCPSCNTVIQPQQMKFDGYVKMNWQDLRTLAVYAKRWSRIFDLSKKGDMDAARALENILANVRQYRPAGAEALVPSSDESNKPLRKVDVKKIGEIGIGDNMPIDLKPGADGKIVSPFFKNLT